VVRLLLELPEEQHKACRVLVVALLALLVLVGEDLTVVALVAEAET
jgi:hypothetical protein